MHATNPKGIVGGFELTLFQRNLKEWQERPSAEAADIRLRVLKESNKTRFDSYSVRNSVLTISHITFRTFQSISLKYRLLDLCKVTLAN